MTDTETRELIKRLKTLGVMVEDVLKYPMLEAAGALEATLRQPIEDVPDGKP